MKRISFFAAILFLKYHLCSGQDTLSNPKPLFFLETEIMTGVIVPNYHDYPPHSFIKSVHISIGKINCDPVKKWTRFFNYPSTGYAFSYTQFGNDSVLGHEYCLLPFVEFKASRGFFRNFQFKFGLGCSYFTKFYNITTNPQNSAIGSKFNWAFQSYLYYNLVVTDRFVFLIGSGYLHSSNGHTQLPNYGLNSAMLSVSSKFLLNSEGNSFRSKKSKPVIDSKKHYFLSYRNSLGIQEYGPAKGPAGTPKKPVYCFSLAGGIIYKQCIKVQTGITYRFYKQHYDDIILKNTPGLADEPFKNASNIFLFLGCELLFGNFSVDVEGGINLHKPFFKSFYEPYASPNTLTFTLKNNFPSRLGLRAYLFNTNNMPSNNLFVGGNIAANFGQADFTELSIGYVRIIK